MLTETLQCNSDLQELLGSPSPKGCLSLTISIAHVHGHMWGNAGTNNVPRRKLDATSSHARASSVCCTKQHANTCFQTLRAKLQECAFEAPEPKEQGQVTIWMLSRQLLDVYTY